MAERFRIVEGSATRHCCFEYTVVDASKRLWTGSSCNEKAQIKEYGFTFDIVCECFEKEDAELICNALNKVS